MKRKSIVFVLSILFAASAGMARAAADPIVGVYSLEGGPSMDFNVGEFGGISLYFKAMASMAEIGPVWLFMTAEANGGAFFFDTYTNVYSFGAGLFGTVGAGIDMTINNNPLTAGILACFGPGPATGDMLVSPPQFGYTFYPRFKLGLQLPISISDNSDLFVTIDAVLNAMIFDPAGVQFSLRFGFRSVTIERLSNAIN